MSCSADRQILGRIDKDGVWLEQLETDPAKHLPEPKDEHLSDEVVTIDLDRPMAEIRATLSKHPFCINIENYKPGYQKKQIFLTCI